MNSKDMCMIQHIPELMESGIISFKIEGRMKSDFYVATIVKAYREAMDSYWEDPENYEFNPKWMELLEKVSHRKYFTGFYFGRNNSQTYESSNYVRNYDIVANVLKKEADGRYFMLEKNRIFPDTEVEVLRSKGEVFTTTLTDLKDEKGNQIEVANKAAMHFSAHCADELKEGDILIQATGETERVM